MAPKDVFIGAGMLLILNNFHSSVKKTAGAACVQTYPGGTVDSFCVILKHPTKSHVPKGKFQLPV